MKPKVIKVNYFKLGAVVLITFLGIIIYSNTFHCSFHFDDEFLLIDNLAIRNLSHLQDIWNFLPCRFILYLSLALNYHFHQLDVFGYHLINLTLHLASAILVWWFTLLTLSTPAMKNPDSGAGNKTSQHADLIALFAGLVFVSHPVQTEAVDFIVQRATSLVTLFYLATLCLYAKSRLHTGRSSLLGNVYYFGALLTAILAMFSKEIAITLPLMILLYEFSFFNTQKAEKFLGFLSVKKIKYLIPFLLTILIIPSTMFFTKTNQAINSPEIQNAIAGTTKISSIDYLLTQFRVIVTYLRLIFVPLNQDLDYDYHISKSLFEFPTTISLIFLVIVFIWAIRLFSNYRIISFSIFWFFLSLLPESSLFSINDVIFEHRLYLPLVGYSMFLVSGAYYLFREKNIKVMIIVLLMIVACNAVLTYQRNKVWRDDLTLWDDTVRKSPHKARPYYNRGLNYYKQDNFALAMPDFNNAIELNPSFSEAYASRAAIFEKQGKLNQSLSDYDKAIELGPNNADTYNNRGSTYYMLCNLTQCLSDYKKAVELNPNYIDAYNNLALTYFKLKDYDEAWVNVYKVEELGAAVNPDFINKLKTASDENISDYNGVNRVNLGSNEDFNEQGINNAKQGNFIQAMSDFTRAVEINPRDIRAYMNRAFAEHYLKDYNKSWADVHKVQALGGQVDPNFLKDLIKSSGQGS